MAFRYRQKYFEDGDIVEPRDWVANMAEYADEFNGFLDRDNLPNGAISSAMLNSESCNSIQKSRTTTTTTLSGDDTGWKSTDGTTKYGEVSFTTKVDSLVFVEWSGTWNWETTLSYGSLSSSAGDNNVLQFKIVVDGIEVARLPLSAARRFYDSGYMCGVLPVPAGNHKVQLFARQWLYGTASSSPSSIDAELNQRELIVWARKR